MECHKNCNSRTASASTFVENLIAKSNQSENLFAYVMVLFLELSELSSKMLATPKVRR